MTSLRYKWHMKFQWNLQIQIWNLQIQILKSTDFIKQKYISFRLIFKYGLSNERPKEKNVIVPHSWIIDSFNKYEKLSQTRPCMWCWWCVYFIVQIVLKCHVPQFIKCMGFPFCHKFYPDKLFLDAYEQERPTYPGKLVQWVPESWYTFFCGSPIFSNAFMNSCVSQF